MLGTSHHLRGGPRRDRAKAGTDTALAFITPNEATPQPNGMHNRAGMMTNAAEASPRGLVGEMAHGAITQITPQVSMATVPTTRITGKVGIVNNSMHLRLPMDTIPKPPTQGQNVCDFHNRVEQAGLAAEAEGEG